MSDRSRRRTAALAALASAVLVATVATGCSVAVQEHPVVLGPGRLRHPTPAATTDEDTSNRIEVFLVKHDRLTGVYRPAPDGRGVHGALRALTAPLADSEQAAGYRTALPGGAGQLRAVARAGIVYVEVPAGFERLGVSEQVLAIGQITDTVTRVSGVNAVQLTHRGHDVDIPVAGGQLEPGPVTAADYRPVTAPEPTTRPRSTTNPGSPRRLTSPSGSPS
jgi:hypothetical protein